MASRVGMQRGGLRASGQSGFVAPAAPLEEQVPAEDRLRPVIAGARARGMADALEALGIAAIMLDRAGMALFVSSAAARFLGAGRALFLASETLLAADSAVNRDIQRAVAAVVEGEDAQVLTLGDSGVRLTVRPVFAGDSDIYQLFRALIVLEEVDRTPISGASTA